MRKEAEKYSNIAQDLFEKLGDPFLISTVYEEKGDMHKEFHEVEEA